MASGRIKGITIQIGADTTPMAKALEGVNSSISKTQTALKDVNKLLKLDPTNTELITQKQKLLKDAISNTSDKLKTLKTYSEQAAKTKDNWDAYQASLKPVEEEIKNTKDRLSDLKQQADKMKTAGEINTDGYKNLQTEITQTQNKLKDLQTTEKEVSSDFGNPVSPERYDALQREIIDTKQDLKSLQDQAKDCDTTLSATLETAGSKVSAAGSKITGVGKGLTAGVTAPVVGIGAAAVAAFKSVDEGADIVIAKTGATGDKAKELTEIYKEAAHEAPGGFTAAGNAVGGLSAELGLNGDALKAASENYMKFAKVTDTDVSTAIDSTADIMHNFGMSSEDSDLLLGALASTMQETGQNAGDLMSGVQQNAASFQEMGLGVGGSVELLGRFKEAGLQDSDMMKALKKAVATYNSEGKNASEGLQDLVTRLQDSSTNAEATSEAYKLFGRNAGTAFIKAAETGKISFGGLTDDMSGYAGKISEVYGEMEDPTDKLEQSLSDLAEAGATLVEAAAPEITALSEAIKDFSDWFQNLSPQTQDFIVKAGLAAAALGPVTTGVGGVVTGIGGVLKVGGGAIKFFSNLGSGAADAATGAEATVDTFSAASDTAATISGDIGGAMGAVIDTTETASGSVGDVATSLGEAATTATTGAQEMESGIGAAMQGISGDAQAAEDAIGGLSSSLSGGGSAAGAAASAAGTGGEAAAAGTAAAGAAAGGISLTGALGAVGIALAVFTATSAILQVTGLSDKIKEAGGDLYDFTHTQSTTQQLSATQFQAYQDKINALRSQGTAQAQDAANSIEQTLRQNTDYFDQTGAHVAGTASNMNVSVTGQVDGMKSGVGLSMQAMSEAVFGNAEDAERRTVLAMSGMKDDSTKSIEELRQEAADKMSGLSADSQSWGSDLGNNFANGIRNTISAVENAASSIANSVASFLHFSEPDVGPLVGFNKWPEELGQNYASGMMAQIPDIKKASGQMASAAASSLSSMKSAAMNASPYINNAYNAMTAPPQGAVYGNSGAAAAGGVTQADLTAISAKLDRVIAGLEQGQDVNLYMDTNKVGSAVAGYIRKTNYKTGGR